MTSSSAESDDTPALDSNWSDNPVNAGECLPESRERTWLEEIALQLETNPHECWQAIESLAQIEPEVRQSIIDELSAIGSHPGAIKLLRLLSSARDLATRSAAQQVLERIRLATREASPGRGAITIRRSDFENRG